MGSFSPLILGLRAGLPLRLLPAFVLGAAAFQLTATVIQSLVKAEYAMHIKSRYRPMRLSCCRLAHTQRPAGSEGLWNRLFGGYTFRYNEELGVYEYHRRALFSLLGLYATTRLSAALSVGLLFGSDLCFLSLQSARSRQKVPCWLPSPTTPTAPLVSCSLRRSRNPRPSALMFC
jgi:hypothetical protein